MTQDQAKLLLRQGIAAAKDGRATDARDLLRQAVRLNSKDEMAWLWLSSVAPNDRERIFCLKQVLALNPQHEFALKGLAALGYEPQPADEVTQEISVPLLREEKHARILPLLDDLLRTYQAEPESHDGLAWTSKSRRRYGEGAARRLKQATVAAAVLVIAGLVVGSALLADTLGLFREAGLAAVVYRPVHTATPTPTMTPTPGFGPTPTPFPERLSVGATRVPSDLGPAGSIYGLATPTPMYPEFDSSVQRRIEPAVGLYSIGRFPQAQSDLATAQASYEGQCYPALVYYHALSYADQGGTTNLNAAARLLEDGLAYTPPGGRYRGEAYDSCPNSPLLYAGLAEVRLRQGRASQAYALTQQALAADPGLTVASLTKAAIEQTRGDLDQAAQTLQDALALSPRDTRLLIRLSDLALAQGRANAALEYAGKALYVDPLLLPALRAQARAYLALAVAASGSNATARIEYYGLAAHSAQALTLYYPGDAEGYLLLAEARLGEQNFDQAEAALNRLLAIDDAAFQDRNADNLRRAYQLRGELYERQGRADLAARDLRRVGQAATGDVTAVTDRLLALDLAEGAYDDAALQLAALLDRSPRAAASEYRLLDARLHVEICMYSALDDLNCDFMQALDLLDNEFIEALPAGQQPEARSLRAQAQYWSNKQRNLPAAIGRAAYQTALEDLTLALAGRDAAIDHYFRGLVLAEMGEPGAALAELHWVRFWSAYYPYPFLPADFDQRVLAVETRAAEARAAETAPETEPGLERETLAPSARATPSATPAEVVPFEQRPQLP